MESTHNTHDQKEGRSPAVSALAIVGFIALILLGMGLAIYAARFMPVALSNIGQAAVSLSGVFNPGDDDAEIEVVDQPATPNDPNVVVTVPIDPPTNGTPVATNPTTPSAPTYQTPPSTGGPYYTPATPSYTIIPVQGGSANYNGNPDLTVAITAVGYCRTTSPDSFRRASEVPENENGGVQFTIKNIGTNVSGKFSFEYDLPTSPSVSKEVKSQRSLNPGGSIDYTLCFTEGRSGNNRDITIEVDSDDDIRESNEHNNRDTETIDIERD